MADLLLITDDVGVTGSWGSGDAGLRKRRQRLWYRRGLRRRKVCKYVLVRSSPST